MSGFDDQLSCDAVTTFLCEFGEWITFEPWQDAPVKIRALIDRDPAMGIKSFAGAATYKHEVQIARDAAAGRLTIIKGKDAMKYPLRSARGDPQVHRAGHPGPGRSGDVAAGGGTGLMTQFHYSFEQIPAFARAMRLAAPKRWSAPRARRWS